MSDKVEADDLYSPNSTDNNGNTMKAETKYIKVAESPEEDPLEVPCEDDNTM